jgi:hypothetical protein
LATEKKVDVTKKKGLLSAFMNPKRIAFALIGTVQQSVVTMTGLAIMMGLDALFHFFLVIVMILKQMDDKVYSDTINVVKTLIELPTTQYSQLVVHCFITGFFLLLFLMFVAVVNKTHSLATLGSMAFVKKILTLLFVALMTFLQIPLLEVLIGMVFLNFND